MGLVFGIWLAVLGMLGAAQLIVARKPDAKVAIDKLAPFQGWIGAISALWGAWGVLSFVLNLNVLMHVPVWGLTFLATVVVLLALGLLLGVGVLKTFIKAPVAQQRLDAAILRLSPFQGTLGLVGIGLGIWAAIAPTILL